MAGASPREAGEAAACAPRWAAQEARRPQVGRRRKAGRWAGREGRGSPVPADSGCPVLRYRKMKERLGLTEIRKQANRMSFGEVGSRPRPCCAPGCLPMAPRHHPASSLVPQPQGTHTTPSPGPLTPRLCIDPGSWSGHCWPPRPLLPALPMPWVACPSPVSSEHPPGPTRTAHTHPTCQLGKPSQDPAPHWPRHWGLSKAHCSRGPRGLNRGPGTGWWDR